MARNTINYFFLGDDRSLQAASRRVEDALGRTESTADRVTSTAIRMGDRLTVASAGLATLGVGAIRSASDAEQAVGAIDSVLGEHSRTVKEFGDTAADSYGLAREEVNRLGAVLGAQLTGMGIEHADAAEEVVKLQQRAADMAATFGGPVSEAVEAIGSLMRGERDPIEKYGVSIKAVDVEARIAAMGLDTSTAAAQKQAEAIAALDLLYEQTATSAGQFARESDTVAGQTARLQANVSNLAADLGEQLLPVASQVLGVTGDLVDTFTALPEQVQAGVVQVGLMVAVLGPMLSVGGRVARTFGDMYTKARELHTAMATLRALGGQTTPSFGALAGAVGGVTAALGIAAVVWLNYQQRQAAAEQDAREFADTLDEQTAALTENSEAWVVNELEKRGALEAAERLGIESRLLIDATLGEADAQRELQAQLDKVRDSFTVNTHAVGDEAIAIAKAREAYNDFGDTVGYVAGVVDAGTESRRRELETLAEARGEYLDMQHALDNGLTPAEASLRIEMQALTDVTDDQTDAQAELEEQTGDTTTSIERQQEAIEKATNPVFRLLDAVDAVDKAEQHYQDTLKDSEATEAERSEAAIAHAQAIARLESAAMDGSVSFDVFSAKLDTWVAQGRISEEQAARIRDRVGEARGQLEQVTGTYPIDVKADVAQAIRAINDLKLSLEDAAIAAAAVARATGIGMTVTSGGVIVPKGVTRHSGGIVDDTGVRRSLDRLQPRERIVVAQDGEEVLTRDNPRHIDNIGRTTQTAGGGLDVVELRRAMTRAVRDGMRQASFGVQLHAAPDVRVSNVMTYGMG